MDLLVKWVRGHMDIVGNDKADREAKKAVTHGSSPLHKLPAPLRKTLPWSKAAVWQEYHRKIKKAAMKFWSRSPRFDRMALIDPDFSHNKLAKLTRNISRNQASILFQLRSGHVPLNTYLHRINKLSNMPRVSTLQGVGLPLHHAMRDLHGSKRTTEA